MTLAVISDAKIRLAAIVIPANVMLFH